MFLFIFDFDNTLGDTYGPYGEGNIFRTKTLPDVEKATEIYEKYRRWPDNIVVYPKLLEEYGITDPESFFREAGMGKQLFTDVVPFLTKLRERHPVLQEQWDLKMIRDLGLDPVSRSSMPQNLHGMTKPDAEIITVILTTGDEDFQYLKTHVTGVDALVDEVFVTWKRNKAENIREIIQKYKPEHTVFIDDHINITSSEFDTPITIYEMNRARTKEWEFVIHELGELPLELLIDSASRLTI